MRLRVIDRGKALRKAIVQTFGAQALIQRCQERKRSNVLEHLPEGMQASVKRALEDAWSATDADVGRASASAPGGPATGQAPRCSGQPAPGL